MAIKKFIEKGLSRIVKNTPESAIPETIAERMVHHLEAPRNHLRQSNGKLKRLTHGSSNVSPTPSPSASAPPPPRVESTPSAPPTKSMPNANLGMEAPQMPGELKIGGFKTKAQTGSATPLSGEPVKITSPDVPSGKTMPSDANLGLEAPQMPGELKIGEFKPSTTPSGGQPKNTGRKRKRQVAKAQKIQAKADEAARVEQEQQDLANQIAEGRRQARTDPEAARAAEEQAQVENFWNEGIPTTSSSSPSHSVSHAAFTQEETAAATAAYEAGTLKGRITTAYGKVKSSINNFIERHKDHPAEYNEYQKRTISSLEGYGPTAPEGKIKFGDTAAAHQKSVYQDTRNFSQELANAKNDEEMNKLFESRGITGITATDEGAARKALEQFQKNRAEAGPGFGDYMEAYHGHAAIAVGTVGMGAIKAFDNGGSRTNAQLYGME